MSLRDLRPLLAIVALALIWALTQSIEGLDVGWLSLAPALVLALPLLAGRYVGEETLLRLSLPPRPRRARPALTLAGVSRPDDSVAGGLLLARRLGSRAPPVALAG